MDLSRIARGGTPINLDRPRLLLFDMAALWLLIQKYGNGYLKELYGPAPSVPKQPKSFSITVSFELKSMEALQYYLWVGLQAGCKVSGEELTLDQVGDFITPSTYPRIFEAIITALFRDMSNPARKEEEGKADAAAARPAAVAEERPKPRKRSTSPKKNASR